MGAEKTTLTDDQIVLKIENALSDFQDGMRVYVQDAQRSWVNGKGTIVSHTRNMDGYVTFRVRLDQGAPEWFLPEEMRIIDE